MRLTPAFLAVGAPVLALAMAASAPAQEEKPLTTSKVNEQTVKVTVTGELDLDYVWRRAEIVAFTGGVSGASAPGNASSENTFEGFVALGLNATLSDNVSATLEFGTKRVDGGKIQFFAPSTGKGSTALALKLREAHLTLDELFMPELHVQFGISTWMFNPRGDGDDSMAFDPRHSQRFNRNVNGASDGPGTLALRAGDPEELEPVGLWVQWQRTSLSLDLVALPAVIEGGSPNSDEAFYALDLFYTMDRKESRIGLIVSATHDPGSRNLVYTYGGGVDWKGIDQWDIYAEAYFQNGRSSTPTVAATSLHVGGYAFRAGAEYSLPGELRPKVGAGLIGYSGDRDAVANGKSSAFLSYENVHDLMILEDMYLGLDWDTNYRAAKITGSVELNARQKNDLKISIILGLTQTSQPVRFVNETTHKLGNEVDLKGEWDLTKQVALHAGAGFLFGSKVLQDSLGGPGTPNAERQTVLFTLGTDVRF